MNKWILLMWKLKSREAEPLASAHNNKGRTGTQASLATNRAQSRGTPSRACCLVTIRSQLRSFPSLASFPHQYIEGIG